MALSIKTLRLLFCGFFPLELSPVVASTFTSVLVLVPILISIGMGASWRLFGSLIESGEVGLSSTGAGVSTVSLAGGSLAISVSMSVRLVPIYGLLSLSTRRLYHFSLR